MAYTNSSLATYKPLGKNHYASRNAILGIIPHCVVGHLSGEDCWGYFHRINSASCNYYIQDDGKIFCFVDEKYGAWTTSNYTVDMNHITVEVASDAKDPYKITDAAYKALVKLTADVYKRNGIKKCYWSESKANDYKPGFVPMHRNYAQKSCPGNAIVNTYYKTGKFCKDVNAILEGNDVEKEKAKNSFGVKYSAHCQSIGWQAEKHDGLTAGTTGQSKRVEAFKLSIPGCTFKVKTHVQSIGWKTTESGDGVIFGTTGKGYRLEAFEVCSVKGLPEGKKLHYQAHIQDLGWSAVATQGYPVGTMGEGKRIEAVRFWVE